MPAEIADITDQRPTPNWTRRVVIATAIAVLAICGAALVPDTFTKLQTGGFTSDQSISARADAYLSANFPNADPNIVLIIEPRSGNPVGAREFVTNLSRIDGVAEVHSYFTDSPVPELKSVNSAGGLAIVTADADRQTPADLTDIAKEAKSSGDKYGVSVRATGSKIIDGAIDELAETSLIRAELVAAPLVALILVLVFGSVWAAALPLIAGGLSVLISLLLVNILTRITDVSTFSLNLATAIGFGLAIDYSLFIVARYREARSNGFDAERARVFSLSTSGRTIVFSAITVMLSLAALLLFPGYFLKSLAYSGIVTVAAVMVVTVILVPMLLVAIGDRATQRYRWSRWSSVEYTSDERSASPEKLDSARPATVRTVLIAILILGVLVAVAAPFLNSNFILRDYRELPASNSARVATEQLARDYPGIQGASAVRVALPGSQGSDAKVEDFAKEIARVDGVTSVDGAFGSVEAGGRALPATPFSSIFSPTGSQVGTWMTVNLSSDPESTSARRTVEKMRTLADGEGALVAGQTSALIDATDGIENRLPEALAIIFVATALLLFLLTGSVILPILGVALSVASLGATFGALTFIFQDGNLGFLLGNFTAFGAINVTAPILLFCIAYGLSMDYQMFILSRISEEHVRGRSDEESVRIGIASTKRVISAAALLIAVVLAAMATSGLTYLKILGVGLAIAVLVDAFIVRLYLLPSIMKLLGRSVWYRPRFLDGPYRVFRLSHSADLALAREDPEQQSIAERTKIT